MPVRGGAGRAARAGRCWPRRSPASPAGCGRRSPRSRRAPAVRGRARRPRRACAACAWTGRRSPPPPSDGRATLRILLDRVDQGVPLAAAWAEEMAPGGRLEQACRHTYEVAAPAQPRLRDVQGGAGRGGGGRGPEPHRAGRPPRPHAGRDARLPRAGCSAWTRCARRKKRYYYVDSVVRAWVRLHGRGRPPSAAELHQAAAAIAADTAGDAPLPDAPPSEDAPAAPRHDRLMEID